MGSVVASTEDRGEPFLEGRSRLDLGPSWLNSVTPEIYVMIELRPDSPQIMNTPSPTGHSDANQSEPTIIPNHPLAAVIGKFEGEIWEATLEEIQRLRLLDRQQWENHRDVG
jgi:hypothetical protein